MLQHFQQNTEHVGEGAQVKETESYSNPPADTGEKQTHPRDQRLQFKQIPKSSLGLSNQTLM